MGQGAAKREVDKGTRLYAEQRFDAAINEWKSALRRMTKKEKLPDKFNTLNYLCMAYFDTGKYREVIACANQQLEMLNSKTMCNNADFMQEAYFNLARGYEKLSEFKKSISYAKSCIEKEQNSENAKDIMSFATICLAKAYHGLSDFYNAINNFDSVLSKTENSPSVHMRFLVFESLGQLFSKLKDYDTAHLYYDRCLDIIVQDAATLSKYKRRIQCQIALPMLHMGRFNDAMEQCEVLLYNHRQEKRVTSILEIICGLTITKSAFLSGYGMVVGCVIDNRQRAGERGGSGCNIMKWKVAKTKLCAIY